MSKQLCLLLIFLCGSCTPSIVDPSVRSQPVTAPQSIAIVNVRTVEIVNDWNGYSDITPILRRYRLRLDKQQLVGNAYVAVGGYGAAGIRQQKTTTAKIPAAVANKFLSTLTKTPLKVGTYNPQIDRPDDYPAIEIRVNTDFQQLIFSSRSQRQDLTPWKIIVTKQGKTQEYISNSTAPTQALQALKPHLAGSELDGIIHKRRQKK
jgi:hypothetical protein